MFQAGQGPAFSGGMMKLGIIHGAALMLAGTLVAAAPLAQAAPRGTARPAASTPVRAPAAAPAPAQPAPAAQPGTPQAGANLQLPSNPVFLGDTQTSVRKA